MNCKGAVILVCLALSYSCAVASEAPKTAATISDLSMDLVAKIKVGSSTGTQIKELLGAPWRTNNYGDCNVVDYQETWEYLGHDADGRFKISIEFDEAGIARIVAKTPAKGPVVVLAATPKSGTQHQH